MNSSYADVTRDKFSVHDMTKGGFGRIAWLGIFIHGLKTKRKTFGTRDLSFSSVFRVLWKKLKKNVGICNLDIVEIILLGFRQKITR